MENWSLLFEGSIDGRPVELWKYLTGELKVKTTQLETESTQGSFEPGIIVMPVVVSSGDPITIEARNPNELIKELLASGFSNEGAAEISRLARGPEA